VGCDNDDHVKLMNELVFDERIDGLSDSCIELMRQLMHPNPEKRMTSDSFLRHPWIQGLTASWQTMEKTHDDLKAFWQHRFRTEILKKFAAASAGGDETTALSEKGLEEFFRTLDLKKKGVLELDDIQTVFRDLGVSDKTISTIFACADLDGTGVVHRDEFKALMSKNNIGNGDGHNGGPGFQVGYLQQRFKSDILNRFVVGKSTTEKEKDNPLSADINNK
jgi:hypothetical protein